MRRIASGLACALAVLATPVLADPPVAHPALWPEIVRARTPDPALEARIDALLARMSIEDKVGQLIQVDIGSITPEDLRTIKVGSVLNGGDSSPGNARIAPPAAWLALADQFYDAAMERTDGRPGIPPIWGIDSVHGDGKIVGATVFPHNIGLGAARDPDLIRRIGEVTASETAALGLDWTFAPTLAVAQDDRWGRTYESYSEDPAVVASYAGAMIEGLQGRAGTPEFMAPGHVIATAKHFLGDGGTGGRDQGDTIVPESTLIDIHAAGYRQALGAGALSVMGSFSSWNGQRMHGNASLLTGVLKQRWGFDGLLVGDWGAHMLVQECNITHCAAAIMAGVDMFMVAEDWRALYANTLEDARSGAITAERLDDAVRRILRVKILAGVLDRGRPSSRATAGRFELLGSPEHRAVARQAVRESMVLLKNEGGLLPLRPHSDILIAGPAADSLRQQCGGWTIMWQGARDGDPFPHGQSIGAAIAEAVTAAGGHATIAPDGTFKDKPDAAIVVFGEQPYAEFRGDRPSLDYSPQDRSDLALLRRLKAAGVPTVAVFLSGRPLWVNAELNASDAFVAAFLPGSEGAGVADVLLRAPDGHMVYDFTGKLSFSWPKRPDQFVLNARDTPYDPLFAFGYGLSYAAPGHVPMLDETRPTGLPVADGPLFGRGRVPDGYVLEIADVGSPAIRLPGAANATEHLSEAAIDRRAQEDSHRFTWDGVKPAEVRIAPARPLDLKRETDGTLSLVVEYRVDSAPTAPVDLAMVGATGTRAAVPVAGFFRTAKPGEWAEMAVPLTCFAARGLDPARVGVPFVVTTGGALTLSVSDVRVSSVAVPKDRCGES